MRYRIWNVTTKKWVLNDDGRVAEFENTQEAAEAIARLHDIKHLNPKHRCDVFMASVITDETN
jgi:hypothetical protein